MLTVCHLESKKEYSGYIFDENFKVRGGCEMVKYTVSSGFQVKLVILHSLLFQARLKDIKILAYLIFLQFDSAMN